MATFTAHFPAFTRQDPINAMINNNCDDKGNDKCDDYQKKVEDAVSYWAVDKWGMQHFWRDSSQQIIITIIVDSTSSASLPLKQPLSSSSPRSNSRISHDLKGKEGKFAALPLLMIICCSTDSIQPMPWRSSTLASQKWSSRRFVILHLVEQLMNG